MNTSNTAPGTVAATTDSDIPFCGAQLGVYLEAIAFPDTAKVGGLFARYYEIDGDVDPALLRAAIARLVEDNDALRLVVAAAGGLARQRCLAHLAPPFATLDCKDDSEAETWITARVAKGFSFDQAPLAEFALMRFPHGRHRLFVLLHHLIADAWGANLAVRRLFEDYGAIKARDPAREPSPRYIDHLMNDAAYRGSDDYKRDADFWNAYVAALPTTAFPPLAGKRRHDAAPCHQHEVRVAGSALDTIRGRSRAVGATAFQGLLACIHQAIARATDVDDLTFGVFRLNRDSPRLRETVGMFTTELPIRATNGKQRDLETGAKEILDSQAQVYAHRRFPSAELGFLWSGRSPRTMVCDVSVSAVPPPPIQLPGGCRHVQLQNWPETLHAAKPLHIFVHQGAAGASTLFQFFFSANHFTAERSAAIAAHFRGYMARLSK
jgi:hypothetical protein